MRRCPRCAKCRVMSQSAAGDFKRPREAPCHGEGLVSALAHAMCYVCSSRPHLSFVKPGLLCLVWFKNSNCQWKIKWKKHRTVTFSNHSKVGEVVWQYTHAIHEWLWLWKINRSRIFSLPMYDIFSNSTLFFYPKLIQFLDLTAHKISSILGLH